MPSHKKKCPTTLAAVSLCLSLVLGACGSVSSAVPTALPPPVATPTVEPQPGAQLFTTLGCHGCHRSTRVSTGPDLRGRFGQQQRLADGTTVVTDEAYLRAAILDPTAQIVAGYLPGMPAYGDRISAAQLTALVQYLKAQ